MVLTRHWVSAVEVPGLPQAPVLTRESVAAFATDIGAMRLDPSEPLVLAKQGCERVASETDETETTNKAKNR